MSINLVSNYQLSTSTANTWWFQREAVFPTRMTLTLMKGKLKGATQGHSLLKRKSEALTKRFRDITRRIDDVSASLPHVHFLDKAVFTNIFLSLGQKKDG